MTIRMRSPLGTLVPLLLLLPLSGCLHASPPPIRELEIAVFDFPTLRGNVTKAFDLAFEGKAYWRTDLLGSVQKDVRFEARAPNGTKYEGAYREGFPPVMELRVANPSTGVWTVTLSASELTSGRLRILVPE